MAYNNGRKVKHIRKIYKKKKTTLQRIFSFVLFVLIIGALVFIGYSAGKPIKEYFQNRSSSGDQTSGWTPPETTTTELTSQTTASPEPEPEPTLEFNAYRLSIDALSDEAALTAQLTQAKNNGYTAVTVPLKADGGLLYFAAENQRANIALAVSGTLSASQIAAAIKEQELIPIAEISMLKDHITTFVYKDLSYMFADGNSMWIDNKLANGGKPWMSPFSESSKQYILDLTAEIQAGGFDYIIASDFVFPPFRNSDLEYIGDVVKDENRYKSLTSMAAAVNSQIKAANGQLLVEIDAAEALNGSAEIFHPEELTDVNFVVSLDFDNLGNGVKLTDSTYLNLKELSAYEKTRTVLLKLGELSQPAFLIPVINEEALSPEDYSEVKRAFSDLGYNAYIVE